MVIPDFFRFGRLRNTERKLKATNTAHIKTKAGIHTAIVVPLPQELKTLGYRKIPENGLIHHSEQVVICLSGVGKENAAYAADRLVQNGANRLISWGTAAALSPDVSPGAIAVPEKIITEQQGIINTDNELRNELLNQLFLNKSVVSDPLVETNSLLSDKTQKSDLAKRSKAKTADMESGAVAEIARKYDAPFVTIRAVSDSADMSIPHSVLSNLKGGTTDITGIVTQAIFSPKEWLPMIKLYYTFSLAEKSLRKAANILLPYLDNVSVINET
jgi:adenosylhomocysteine nucleosidase